MDPVKIIRLKESILADNDADAEELRRQTKDAGLCYVNLMSSPGSGKTSTILALIDALKKRGGVTTPASAAAERADAHATNHSAARLTDDGRAAAHATNHSAAGQTDDGRADAHAAAGLTDGANAATGQSSAPLSIGVMEADIDSDVDAQTIQDKAGVPAVQLHTGGMCHLDAEMSRQGLRALGIPIVSRATSILTMPSRQRHFDLVILENVGNLVCPAEFDTGADLNLVILSVPEGDDKPLKYPLVFTKCDAVIINKIDALPVFNFDIEKCTSRIRERSASAEIFPVSAKTGEGIDRLADWIETKVRSRIS